MSAILWSDVDVLRSLADERLDLELRALVQRLYDGTRPTPRSIEVASRLMRMARRRAGAEPDSELAATIKPSLLRHAIRDELDAGGLAAAEAWVDGKWGEDFTDD
jgi:hypothetical protein